MKRPRTIALALAAAATLTATACSKEVEQKWPESKLVGIWAVPLSASPNMPNLVGKNLVINEDHTGMLDTIVFSNWKLAGDELQLVSERHSHRGQLYELKVLRYTVDVVCDSTLMLTGVYRHVMNDSVALEAAMSGIYNRQ